MLEKGKDYTVYASKTKKFMATRKMVALGLSFKRTFGEILGARDTNKLHWAEAYRPRPRPVVASKPTTGTLKQAEALKHQVLPQLQQQGSSLSKPLYIKASELPKKIDWLLYGGNFYGAMVAPTDSRLKIKLSLERKIKVNPMFGTEARTERFMEGKTLETYSEINPDATKIKGQGTFQLVMESSGTNQPEAYVCILLVYRSKENTVNDFQQNKAEDFYAKQDEAKMDGMATELLYMMNKEMKKTQDILKKEDNKED